MVRDNTAASEQLKATQEQILRENAAAAEQLKTTQQQIARLLPRDFEKQLRPKPSLLSIAASKGKPVPKPSQGTVR